MKQLGLGLLGALVALLCLTVASNSGYLAIGAVASILLYLLFFTRHSLAVPLLVGWAVGLELFGTHHFGSSLLLAVVMYGLHWLFGELIRFTSPYSRFIVAMLLNLVLFSLLYYPLVGYFQRLLGLVLVALVLATLSAALRRFTEAPTHALI